MTSTGVHSASATTAAYCMESAAKTMNPNAPQITHAKAAVENPLKEAVCAAVTLNA